MSLRTQKRGYQKPWTLEELKAGFEHFYKEHNRYPTGPEIDAYPYLSSARSIERRFGGLIELRAQLKLPTQIDLRTGEHSTRRAVTINERAHKVELVVYEFLQKIFGKEFVHREYFFTDDRRTRADFFVYDSEKGFCVDVFYPANRRNLIGCINSKLGKYYSEYMRQYPVIFLQMNESIPDIALQGIVNNKKRPLLKGQYLMSWGAFREFCKSRNPLKVLGS